MTSVYNDEKPIICTSNYTEEEWVDFVMGKLPHIKRQQLESHLESCPACRQHVEEWSLLCSAGWAPSSDESVASLLDYARDSKQLDQLMPDQKYLYSLQRVVKRQARLKQLKRKLRDHKYIAAGAAAAIFLIMMSALLYNNKPVTPNHVDQYVQHYEPGAASFVNAVDSARYRVETAEGDNGNGYIWLKDDLSEVFLWLENLPEIDLKDYQAWAMSGKEASSLGIIQRVGSEGHLYTQTSYLHPTDFIMLTVEPKGGSIVPTSKQIVLVVKQQ